MKNITQTKTKSQEVKKFDPRPFLLKLPKNKKVKVKNENGIMVEKWETVTTDYLPVAARILWFRTEHPIEEGWRIITHRTYEDWAKGAVIYKAEIVNPQGIVVATATKAESRAGFQDYVEKSETGAVGRALALAGYGTQFAPELAEEERLADAPVEKQPKLTEEDKKIDELAQENFVPESGNYNPEL